MARRPISDELWLTLEPLLSPFIPSPKDGRRRSVDDRAALNGILFVLQTGLPWEDLPQELGLGSGMTCWRRLRHWQASGVWSKLHQAMLSKLREHDRIDWSRASIDSASVASPGGQETGPNTTDRGKLGSTRHLVVDAQGIPLALTVTGANRHDSMAFEATLDALVAVPGLRGRPRKRQDKLHADKGYDFERCRRYLKRRGILVAADPSGSTHWATAEMHSSRPSDFGYHLMARISTGRIPMIVSHRDDGFRPVCASELGTR